MQTITPFITNGTILPLWSGMAPEESPNLTVFLAPAATATGAGVVICPGGGYGGLATEHEGVQIAQWLNARGVAGLMLRYRHAPHQHPVPLGDARRALRLVRAHAGAWGLDPARLGTWGFSAGGHLTASLGTQWDAGDPAAADPVERESCRPDFLILSYPVITMTLPHTHRGSRVNLLGEDATPALVEEMSCERRVTADTPPTFLFHTDNDGAVPVENSILFYSALRAAGVPAELHVYADGPHGVGLCLHHPILGTWPARLEAWLRGRGVV